MRFDMLVAESSLVWNVALSPEPGVVWPGVTNTASVRNSAATRLLALSCACLPHRCGSAGLCVTNLSEKGGGWGEGGRRELTFLVYSTIIQHRHSLISLRISTYVHSSCCRH